MLHSRACVSVEEARRPQGCMILAAGAIAVGAGECACIFTRLGLWNKRFFSFVQ